MGGRGSGRPASYSGRAKTAESLPLDIRRLQRAGALTPGRAFSWRWMASGRTRASIQIHAEPWQIELVYRYTCEGQPVELVRQVVLLESTPCTLGGSRPWFRCPTCSRRVAIIYGAGRLFGCRPCKSLAYASQFEDGGDRAIRPVCRRFLGGVS